MTPPCPIRSQPGMGCQAHRRPNEILELVFYSSYIWRAIPGEAHTRFLYAL